MAAVKNQKSSAAKNIRLSWVPSVMADEARANDARVWMEQTNTQPLLYHNKKQAWVAWDVRPPSHVMNSTASTPQERVYHLHQLSFRNAGSMYVEVWAGAPGAQLSDLEAYFNDAMPTTRHLSDWQCMLSRKQLLKQSMIRPSMELIPKAPEFRVFTYTIESERLQTFPVATLVWRFLCHHDADRLYTESGVSEPGASIQTPCQFVGLLWASASGTEHKFVRQASPNKQQKTTPSLSSSTTERNERKRNLDMSDTLMTDAKPPARQPQRQQQQQQQQKHPTSFAQEQKTPQANKAVISRKRLAPATTPHSARAEPTNANDRKVQAQVQPNASTVAGRACSPSSSLDDTFFMDENGWNIFI